MYTPLRVNHAPEKVRKLVAEQVDMQFHDVHCMLRLPIKQCTLDAGCNLASAHVLIALIAGSSVVFYAPEKFRERGGRDKLFNEVMQVPLILHGPGIEEGVDRRPAQHIDIPPTILDALGLPPHPSFQGISLLAAKPDPARSRYIMAQSPLAHQYAVVREGFKLIYDVRRDRTSMFNLVEDPVERKHLALAMPEEAKALRGRLDAWRAHQLSYYRNPREQARRYPPVLDD